MADEQTFEMHEHSYTSGPLARAGGGHLLHSHEGGDHPHSHPDTGPSRFLRKRKHSKRPFGPQLPYIEHTPEQSTFRVVFHDEYTAGHAAAGISRERWEEERAYFLAGGFAPAVERMVTEFRLTPIFELGKGEERR